MEPNIVCKADVIARDHTKLYRQEYPVPIHLFLYRPVGGLDVEELCRRLPVKGFYTRGRPENNPLGLLHDVMGWDTANGRLAVYVLGCGRVVFEQNRVHIKTGYGPEVAASALESAKQFLGITADIKLQQYTTAHIVRDCFVRCTRYYV